MAFDSYRPARPLHHSVIFETHNDTLSMDAPYDAKRSGTLVQFPDLC